jgi:hypothetical protein
MMSNRKAFTEIDCGLEGIDDPDDNLTGALPNSDPVYQSLPTNKRKAAPDYVQGNNARNRVVPNLCLSSLETPRSSSTNSINDGEYISNEFNELTMIARTLSAVGKRTCIRTCVKQLLFRRLKFFNRNKHGGYDLRPNSVCGIVIATCNVKPQDATPTWWADIRTLIVRTHTDHRNNVIKTMRTRFRGTNDGNVCDKFICKCNNLLHLYNRQTV